MADGPDKLPSAPDRLSLVQRLVKEANITEEQARELIALLGSNWPSLYTRGPVSDQETLVARCRSASRLSSSVQPFQRLNDPLPALRPRGWATDHRAPRRLPRSAAHQPGTSLQWLVPGMNSARYSQKRSFRDGQYTVSCANAASRRRSPVGLPALGAPARTWPPTCSGLS